MKLISSAKQVDSIFKKSIEQPILIFIHSSMCLTSANAENEMEKLEKKINVPIYYCTVQKQPEVSDKIEKLSGVIHESPQAILVKDEKGIEDWDHEQITENNIFEEIMKQ